VESKGKPRVGLVWIDHGNGVLKGGGSDGRSRFPDSRRAARTRAQKPARRPAEVFAGETRRWAVEAAPGPPLHCSWRLRTRRAHHERRREGSEGAPGSSPALSARGESSADDHATRRLPVADSAMSGANIPPASAENRGARSLDDMDFNDVFDGNRSPGNSPHRKSIAAAREVRPDSPEPSRTRRSLRMRATRLPPHPCDALFAHEPPALPPASRRLSAPRTTRPA
jgi:hypothetical protein